ncbi:MAG: helix-turn-helix domain-containing protein [Myxococcota bacterium]
MPAPQSSPKSASSSQRVAPTLWAVASGKGGVGKSVVSSSLAIGLAQSGPRVVAVDLDLGGANLHTHFGCETARHTLADVLRGKVPSLEDAFADTSVPGVRLLSGARSPLDAANLKFAQKQKLLRDLRKVDAAHVVLDIGAGSAFNTLDAFLVADRRVLVITPEKPAIENAYHFLKAAFFRSLRAVAKEPEVQGVLLRVLDDARRRGATPRELVEAALETDVHAGNRLRAAMRAFEVELVVNRVEQDGHDPGPEMAAACEGHLGAVLRPVASLLTDAAVPAAVEREVPVLQLFPGSAFSKGIHQMVEALLDPDLRKRRRKAPAPVSLSAKASARLAERRAATRREHVRVRPPERPSDVVLPAFTGDDPAGHLRVCRELQGHSLETMASRTKIRKLAELEDEAFAALPPEPYLRGYVQQYAQMLGIHEADEVAAAYLERFHENRAGKRQNWRQAMMKALGLGGKKARREPEAKANSEAAGEGDPIHRNAAAAVELACAGGPELDFEVELAPH